MASGIDPCFTIRATPRRTLSAIEIKRLLYEYKYKCAECHKVLPPTYELEHKLSLTHRVWSNMPAERAKILANEAANIQPLCRECHGEKTQRETLRDAKVRRSLARSRAGLPCPNCSMVHSPYFYPACFTAAHKKNQRRHTAAQTAFK